MYHFHSFKNQPKRIMGSIDNNNSDMPYDNIYKTSNMNNIPIMNSFSLTHQDQLYRSQSVNNEFQAKPREQFDKTKRCYSIDEIISIDLFDEITKGNFDTIDDHIEKMLSFSLSNSSNYNLSQLISSFQLLLNYLFNLQSDEMSSNNLIEDRIDELHAENSEKKVEKVNRVISNQKSLIINLIKRQSLLKRVIVANGHEAKLLNSLRPTMPKRTIYVCDVCEDNKIYSNYDTFHSHYVRSHINTNINDYDYGMNKGYQFDMEFSNKKLRNMTDEMIDAFNLSLSHENKQRDDIEVIEDIGDVIRSNEEKLNEIQDVPLLNIDKSIKMNVYVNQKDDASHKSKESSGIQMKSGFEKKENENQKDHSLSSDKKTTKAIIAQVIQKQEKDYINILNDFKSFEQEIMEKINDIAKNE